MSSAAPKKDRTIFEWLWDFFASVKVAIVIIVLITLSAMIGTILPQENFIPSSAPEDFYQREFGTFGKIYYTLGFSHMYTSWWFVTLLLALGVSLVICSLERVVPLYKSLQRQEVKPALSVLQRKKLYVAVEGADDSAIDQITEKLAKQRYKIRREGSAFLAEKMRLSRFGAYIIHIGLIIIIIGAVSRLIPGWYISKNIWIEEGQTVIIPGTNFYLRNDEFILERYEDGRPSHYETKATIIENGQEVSQRQIIVNHPVKYKGTLLFQASYKESPTLKLLNVELKEKTTGKKLGDFQIDFPDIKPVYKAGDYTIKAIDYFPDFDMKDGQPVTRSTQPINPVMLVQIEGPGIEKPSLQLFFMFKQFELQQDTNFELAAVDGKMVDTTGIRVQKDNGIPIVYGGCAVVLVGLILVFYFQHRRVWGQLQAGVLHIGAQTSKNWFGMKKELERIFQRLNWKQEIQIQQGGKKE